MKDRETARCPEWLVVLCSLVTLSACASSGTPMRKEWLNVNPDRTTTQAYFRDKSECTREAGGYVFIGLGGFLAVKGQRDKYIETCMKGRGWEERKVPKGTGIDD